MALTKENRSIREEFVPCPLCQPQDQHKLSWDWTHVFKVTGRQQIASAMARPPKNSDPLSTCCKNLIKQQIHSSILYITYSGMWKRLCVNFWIIQRRYKYLSSVIE